MKNFDEHDFSAIDKHIAWEQDKNNQILSTRKSKLWLVWAKVFGAFLLALGFFIILLSIAYFIYINSVRDNGPLVSIRGYSENSIEELKSSLNKIKEDLTKQDGSTSEVLLQEIIEKLDSIEQNSFDSDSAVLNDLNNTEPSPPRTLSTEQKITKTFTVFETVNDVTTGRNYNPNNTKTPFYQYCYFEVPLDSEGGKSVRTDLGLKNGNQNAVYRSENELNINCRFIDGDN